MNYIKSVLHTKCIDLGKVLILIFGGNMSNSMGFFVLIVI